MVALPTIWCDPHNIMARAYTVVLVLELGGADMAGLYNLVKSLVIYCIIMIIALVLLQGTIITDNMVYLTFRLQFGNKAMDTLKMKMSSNIMYHD